MTPTPAQAAGTGVEMPYTGGSELPPIGTSGAGGFAPIGYNGGAGADGVVYVNSGVYTTYDPAGETFGRGPLGATSQNPMVPSTFYLNRLQSYYHTIGLRPQYDAIVDQLRAAGYDLGDNPSYDEVAAVYEKVLVGASFNPKYTPEQFLQIAAAEHAYDDPANTPQATTTTSTSTGTTAVNDSSVNLTGILDAKALVNGALGQFLGRRATPEEIKSFHALLNQQEQANPTTTVGSSTRTETNTATVTPAVAATSTPNGTPGGVAPGGPATPQNTDNVSSGSSSRNTTTAGGIESGGNAQIAEDYARSRPTFAGTQMNTVMMDLFHKAILNKPAGMVL